MAANRATMNAWMHNTLNINPAALRTILLDQQGFNTSDALHRYKVKDMESVARAVRRPGGAAAGHQMSYLDQRALEMAVCHGHYMRNVQRPFDTDEATLDVITASFDSYEENQALSTELPAFPTPCTNYTNIRPSIEAVDQWLEAAPAALKGAPLSYVTRADVNPPALADDPGYCQPSRREELKRRARHTGELYQQDNGKVWDMINHVYGNNSTMFGWIRQFRNDRDGREAYLAIRTHYMGANYRNMIKARADRTMQTTTYNGKKNFTFENCASRLNDAFTDLHENGEPVSEEKKVRVLLDSTQDANLMYAKAHVVGTHDLLQDFDRTVDYISSFQTLQQGLNPFRSIAGIDSRGGSGRGGRFGRGGGRGRGRFGHKTYYRPGYRGGGGRGGGGRGHGGRGGGGRGFTRPAQDTGKLAGKDLTGFIDRQTWNSLSQNEVNQVWDARGKPDRKVSAAKRSVQEETAEETPPGMGMQMGSPGKKPKA